LHFLADPEGEIERVERVRPENGEIEIYTPDEFSRLLSVADDDFLPCLLVGGLAGLRSSEIERLDWKEIWLAERFIEVKKGKTKTASRRLVPVVDSLAAWLTPLANPNRIREHGRASTWP
jgi:integrase